MRERKIPDFFGKMVVGNKEGSGEGVELTSLGYDAQGALEGNVPVMSKEWWQCWLC